MKVMPSIDDETDGGAMNDASGRSLEGEGARAGGGVFADGDGHVGLRRTRSVERNLRRRYCAGVIGTSPAAGERNCSREVTKR